MGDPDQASSTDLATELLLGKPKGDPDGRYHLKREYPRGERELMARAALADELRKEAPQGYFVGLLAALIDPRVEAASMEKQAVKFIPPKGGRRSSGRLDLEIAAFIREQHCGVDAAVVLAKEHFHVSESRVWQAWKLFARVQTNPHI
jgi:hypothetical protein